MTPSQDARAAAAKLLETQNGPSLYVESVLRGEQDDGDAVQAFARFEAHLRSTSPVAHETAVDDTQAALCSTDERQSASDTEAMRLALNECMDKLWVLRCNSRDAGDREAAERAFDMGKAALAKGGAS